MLELRGTGESCWSAGAELGTVERKNTEIRFFFVTKKFEKRRRGEECRRPDGAAGGAQVACRRGPSGPQARLSPAHGRACTGPQAGLLWFFLFFSNFF